MINLLLEILLHLAVALGVLGLLGAAGFFSFFVYLVAHEMRQGETEPVRFAPPLPPALEEESKPEGHAVRYHKHFIQTGIGRVWIIPN